MTIAIRSFAGDGDSIAVVDPTYSLYKVLADIQGAHTIKIPLEAGFALPQNLAEKASEAKLLLIPRPNAYNRNIKIGKPTPRSMTSMCEYIYKMSSHIYIRNYICC